MESVRLQSTIKTYENNAAITDTLRLDLGPDGPMCSNVELSFVDVTNITTRLSSYCFGLPPPPSAPFGGRLSSRRGLFQERLFRWRWRCVCRRRLSQCRGRRLTPHLGRPYDRVRLLSRPFPATRRSQQAPREILYSKHQRYVVSNDAFKGDKCSTGDASRPLNPVRVSPE
jgi:hypothetical protein